MTSFRVKEPSEARPDTGTGTSKNKNVFCFSYTLTLRFTFLLVLGVGAVVCGIVATNITDDLEEDNGERNYDSVATSVLLGAKDHAEVRRRANEIFALMYQHAFPNTNQWPNVALPGFQETEEVLKYLSRSTFHTFSPLVRPDQGEEFLEFALEYYRKQGFHESSAGYDNALEHGFWQFYAGNVEGPAVTNFTALSSDGTSPEFDYQYQIFSPIFQSTHPNAAPYYLADMHLPGIFGLAIEQSIRCSERAKPGDDCTSVTTQIFPFDEEDSPITYFITPIYPANDPTTIVGSIHTNFHWVFLFEDVVPRFVTGLYCVLSWGSKDDEAFTLIIVNGGATPVGLGDLHDPSYDEFGRSIVVNDFGINTTIYTLTVYPSSEWFATFETNSSHTIAAGLTSTFAFCALVFLLYDYFMRGESRERRIILETKRKFVRFISHEIRTPLSTVLMGIELLRAELEGAHGQDNAADVRPERKKSFESLINLTTDIQENGVVAVEILNDVLNYDKIETGEFVLEFSCVNILHLLRSTVAKFEIQAKKSNTALKFSVESGAQDDNLGVLRRGVIGDGTRLRQVVRNLVSNALKFTPEEGGAVDVVVSFRAGGLPNAPSLIQRLVDSPDFPSDKQAPAPKRSGSVRVDVIDNGAGMTSEQLARLFQEGVQFDVNKLQHGGGSGLGLHIARGLAEGHGGKVSADSKGKGMGATFTLELPLYHFHKSALQDDFDVESRSFTEVSDPLMRSFHVLVVDDVASNRKVLIRLLERSGHTCVPAINGFEAIQKYEETRASANTSSGSRVFDCVLMDYEMPKMNGPEACSILRDKGCTSFIVGVTGNVLAEDVAYFKSKGANEVLGKPCTVQSLEGLWKKHF